MIIKILFNKALHSTNKVVNLFFLVICVWMGLRLLRHSNLCLCTIIQKPILNLHPGHCVIYCSGVLKNIIDKKAVRWGYGSINPQKIPFEKF